MSQLNRKMVLVEEVKDLLQPSRSWIQNLKFRTIGTVVTFSSADIINEVLLRYLSMLSNRGLTFINRSH